MEVYRFRFPTEAYPRYSYFSRNTDRLMVRYGKLLKKLDLHDVYKVPDPTSDEVEVQLMQSITTNFKLQPEKFTAEQAIKVEIQAGEMTVFESVQEIVQKTNISPVTPTIMVIPLTPTQGVDTFNCLSSLVTSAVFVVEKKENLQKKQSELYSIFGNVCEITTPTGLSEKIGNLLERVVFRRIRDEISLLHSLCDIAKDQKLNGVMHQITKAVTREIHRMLGHSRCFQGWKEEMDDCERHVGLVGQQQETTPPSYLDKTPAIKAIFKKKDRQKCYILHRTSLHLCQVLTVTTSGKLKACNDQLMGALDRKYKISDLDLEKESAEAQGSFSSALAAAFSGEKLTSDESELEELRMVLRMKKKTITTECKTFIEGIRSPSIMHKHWELIAAEDDNILRMLWEADSLMKKSVIPDNERPFAKLSAVPRISPTLVRKLDSVKSVRGFGYRLGRLNVHVNEKDLKDGGSSKKAIEEDISKVLCQYKIADFVVVPVPEHVKLFREVGARIKPNPDRNDTRYGTLGGFAHMADKKGEQTLCALLSKHVVRDANAVYLDQNNNGHITVEIGSVVRCESAIDDESCEGEVDIAAATILPQEVSSCQTKFKNSKMQQKEGELFIFETATENEIENLNGTSVHICGAFTKPGVGIISTVEYYHRPRDVIEREPYVLIEDDDPDEPFCTDGDSGSIVCADTPDDKKVRVLSMVKGCVTRGKNLTFRLTQGLDYLQQKSGNHFTLCT